MMFITKARHEREIEVIEDLLQETRAVAKLLEAKFKKAITDLEREVRISNDLGAEIASLRPDAEKFRAKAKADAERKKARRAAAKKGAA